MSRRFELIVFDWDGTLIDSADAISACIQQAARDLGHAVPEASRARYVIGLGLLDALALVIPGLQPNQYAALVERYRHHFFRRDAELPLFSGTREMLSELRVQGHTLAVATGKGSAGLARALEHSRLGEFFAVTRCADQTAPKPDPAMLHEIMAATRIDAGSTLMIGDTSHDLKMAEAAGVAAIGIAHGAHPRTELERCSTLALVDSTAELVRWLRSNA